MLQFLMCADADAQAPYCAHPVLHTQEHHIGYLRRVLSKTDLKKFHLTVFQLLVHTDANARLRIALTQSCRGQIALCEPPLQGSLCSE